MLLKALAQMPVLAEGFAALLLVQRVRLVSDVAEMIGIVFEVRLDAIDGSDLTEAGLLINARAA